MEIITCGKLCSNIHNTELFHKAIDSISTNVSICFKPTFNILGDELNLYMYDKFSNKLGCIRLDISELQHNGFIEMLNSCGIIKKDVV